MAQPEPVEAEPRPEEGVAEPGPGPGVAGRGKSLDCEGWTEISLRVGRILLNLVMVETPLVVQKLLVFTLDQSPDPNTGRIPITPLVYSGHPPAFAQVGLPKINMA